MAQGGQTPPAEALRKIRPEALPARSPPAAPPDICALMSTRPGVPADAGAGAGCIGLRATHNSRRPHSSLDGTTPDQAYFNPLPIRMAA